jgi:hypothetical protein
VSFIVGRSENRISLMDKAELWLRLFQECTATARHHEQQRATVAGFVSALAAGVLTLAGIDRSLSVSDLPAALFLFTTGVFGRIFSVKQFERYNLYMERARHYREALDVGVKGSRVIELKRTADKVTAERSPCSHRWKLGLFWVALHALIACSGLLIAVMSVIGVGVPL